MPTPLIIRHIDLDLTLRRLLLTFSIITTLSNVAFLFRLPKTEQCLSLRFCYVRLSSPIVIFHVVVVSETVCLCYLQHLFQRLQLRGLKVQLLELYTSNFNHNPNTAKNA